MVVLVHLINKDKLLTISSYVIVNNSKVFSPDLSISLAHNIV